MSIAWEGKLDPSEILDFEMNFADADAPLLEPGETISTFSLALTPEAAAYGLQIKSGGGYDAALSGGNTRISLWLQVQLAYQSDPDFVDGVSVGVEATIVTDSVPSRTRQRTFIVEVIQQ